MINYRVTLRATLADTALMAILRKEISAMGARPAYRVSGQTLLLVWQICEPTVTSTITTFAGDIRLADMTLLLSGFMSANDTALTQAQAAITENNLQGTVGTDGILSISRMA